MNNADEPRSLVKKSSVKIPPALAYLFNDPPLVGDEKREDYENLLRAVVDAIKPGNDAVVLLLARDLAVITWEMRREEIHKQQVIKSAYSYVVSRLLSISKPFSLALPPPTTRSSAKSDKEAKQWVDDPEARQRIDKKLLQKGYDASYIATAASIRAATFTEAINRRIAIQEVRRATALKTIEQYSEASARRLATATDVIEGEFTEAAE